MLFVTPVHRLIVPTTLVRAAEGQADEHSR
jgi:hypothetical protein